MPALISFLRAVNVGGRNPIKMEALRALYAALKFQEVQTHLQSGNVVFRTEKQNLEEVADEIRSGIEGSFGFRPEVMVRTCRELRDIVKRNPFKERGDFNPSKLLVLLLSRNPGAAAREKIVRIKTNREEIKIDRRELYVYFPDGMGPSKLSIAALERALATPATGRNWNTITKSLELAERLKKPQPGAK